MSAVLKLAHDIRHMSDLPAVLNDADPWTTASEGQRQTAVWREVLVRPLADLVGQGASINKASQLLATRLAAGVADAHTRHVARQLSPDEALSMPTLKRWLSAYLKSGKAGLLPQHTGRVRRDYGWEERAVALYNQPSKPGYSDVAHKLRAEGFGDATNSRVKRFIQALPATLGEYSPARIGRHLHRLTRQKFQRRSLDEVLVGEIYAGDGHTCDCYVAHPNTGKPFRPELTAFIDIKSGYLAGFWFTESESAVSTLFALSHAMRAHDHVPAWVYVDQGAGYRSKLLNDDNTGFYAKFDIGVIGALPGNPHGKGWIEEFFRLVRDRHDKFFADGQVYCGDDMAPEVNRRLSADLAMGRRQLPSLHSYFESFRHWLDKSYHAEPRGKLGGRTSAQAWAELTPVSVGLDMESVVRPRQECTVLRQTVRLHNRFYFAEALALYDAQKLVVEYDLFDDKHVWIFDQKGRFVVQATLANKIGVLPTSRLEEGRDRRLQGQIKRLERKAAEARARRADPIEADGQVRAIEDLGALALPGQPASARGQPSPRLSHDAPDIDIDILDWRNPS
ncbi:MAG: Mu transposase C-terminal domain-containing protein [Comamonas sp.]